MISAAFSGNTWRVSVSRTKALDSLTTLASVRVDTTVLQPSAANWAPVSNAPVKSSAKATIPSAPGAFGLSLCSSLISCLQCFGAPRPLEFRDFHVPWSWGGCIQALSAQRLLATAWALVEPFSGIECEGSICTHCHCFLRFSQDHHQS